MVDVIGSIMYDFFLFFFFFVVAIFNHLFFFLFSLPFFLLSLVFAGLLLAIWLEFIVDCDLPEIMMRQQKGIASIAIALCAQDDLILFFG